MSSRFQGWTIADTMKNQRAIVIGIDPDIDKCGVATLYKSTKHMCLESYDFGTLVDYLIKFKNRCNNKIDNNGFIVVIEAGWLNRSNWHLSSKDNVASASKKGEYLGRNFQVGFCLESICQQYDIPYKLQPPLRKCWKGNNGKITHEEFLSVTNYDRNRTNQETRDAGLLAWNEAGFPIVIKADNDIHK